ncbi:autotransporter domain-containing protein [Enterobacteriaceae bacterium H4N4]|uniref:Autotransporter domain-containing protein n=1 Tax=Silvania confinis TaxID=2926470 RepID=A0A9J6QJM4_9ENTR|nr:autotransporter domain-containing protein [Silvania confinis]MCU6669550.1 autotransporter domain-containing protein [Silvania confinis]
MEKKRLSQLISLLLASTAAQSYAATDMIIDSPVSNVQIANATDWVHITGQGSITGRPAPALSVNHGVTVNTLTNDGVISNTDTFLLFTSNNTVQIDGTVDTFNNNGTITNNNQYQSGHVVALNASGVVNNFTNSGTLQASSTYFYGASGIYNQGTMTSLINDGEINGGGYGVYNSGAIDSLENNGQITATETAIYSNSNNGSTVGTIVNNGVLNGGWSGIYLWNYNNQGPSTHIVNNGLLTGGSFALFVNSNSSEAVTITNAGVIRGDIYSTSDMPFVINGGTTTQGTLTGLNDATGTLTSSNVVFGTGSLLLNDNVNTAGGMIMNLASLNMGEPVNMTTGTVVNEAASLQVNNNITITGDYHQKAAATLISGVADLTTANGDVLTDSGYGRLNVTGNATVDAGSSINLLRTGSSYKFAEGQRYVVIAAAGSDTHYNAESLNYKAVGYDGEVKGSVYDEAESKALVLTLTTAPVIPEPQPEPQPEVTPPVMTPPDVTTPIVTEPTQPAPADPTPAQPGKRNWATIPSATAALGGLASYTGISSPQLLDLYNASLAVEGQSEANRAGEQLSTSQNLNASSAATVATSTAQAVVGAHIDAVRNPQAAGTSGVATGDDYASNWIVWGQPFGGYARQDSSDQVSGYTAKFGGLIIGADRALGDDWRLGAAVNYSNTSVHGKDNLSGNTSTADNYGVIGYAGYTGDPWYLNLSAGLNRQNYSSVRRADFTGFSGAAHGKFNGQSVTLQTEFGYPFTLPADVVLTPLAALTYGYQHVDGYNETGGNGMALDVGSTHAQSVVSDIGARIEKTFATGLGSLTPFAQVSWIHQYDNRQVSSHATYAADAVGETRFITKGASPVKDMAGLAIGSTLYDANELSVDARYDLQAGERYQAHTFSLRLRKSF